MNNSRVTEVFVVQDGVIYLKSLYFKDFGAGMPTELLPGQQLTELPNGYLRIDGFDIALPSLHLLVGAQNHTLYLGNETITLVPGHVHVYVERIFHGP